jgi:mono/diheme cytochrome c family protein
MDSVSLRHGYELYINKCGSCHTLYRPTKFREEKWMKEVPNMGDSAHLTNAETETILRYVLTRREVLLTQKNNHGG